MHPCPSCAAPLDEEGICTSCGALTRGFFRGLELGTPQLAAAVAHGLDFYLLLGVAPSDEIRAAARRYRQLRVLFPDDPGQLAPEPARRLELLELAGRVLTDPQLRSTYDQLRSSGAAELENQVLRCAGCAAPFPPGAARCAFCGTPRPSAPAAPAAPPESGPPASEPVDYYAMLGLNAEHLLSVSAPIAIGPLDRWGQAPGPQHPPGGAAPTPTDIDAAALANERKLLLTAGYTPSERDERLAEIEIARRILRDPQRRSRYDALLLDFRKGLLGSGRLEALQHLQNMARAELAEARGEQPSADQGGALLRQGLGYLNAGLAREAIDPLRRAIAALPDSAAAHQAYVQAILGSDDPLALGAHMLRQALKSLETIAESVSALPNQPALAALCQGLLARDNGDAAAAEAELRRAAALDPNLAPAWRGLAALALSRGATAEGLSFCSRALALDPRDERTLLMMFAAYQRSGQLSQARELAGQIASLRGEHWTAAAVLHELGG